MLIASPSAPAISCRLSIDRIETLDQQLPAL
jgi:hypothetical protein